MTKLPTLPTSITHVRTHTHTHSGKMVYVLALALTLSSSLSPQEGQGRLGCEEEREEGDHYSEKKGDMPSPGFATIHIQFPAACFVVSAGFKRFTVSHKKGATVLHDDVTACLNRIVLHIATFPTE